MVARREGDGSVFQGTSDARVEPSEARRADPVSRRVLVVEDEALICVDTAETLEHQGFEVHVALSGEDALRRLRGGLAIDVLFTDINLAGPMTGETLAERARELLPDVAVVYTSGTVMAPSHCVAGARFIPKPYNPERVGRVLAEMIAEA
jgi:two-component system, response regulator PdtaR